jgi:hypothetical protein
MIPFLVVAALSTIRRHIPSRALATIIVLFLVLRSVASLLLPRGAFLPLNYSALRTVLESNAEMGRQLSELDEILRRESERGHEQEPVIMTRDPWEVHWSTGHKAIMIPNGSLDSVFEAARRYGANYLLLPARKREMLDGLYRGSVSDERFELAAAIPGSDLKLFRINLGH